MGLITAIAGAPGKVAGGVNTRRAIAVFLAVLLVLSQVTVGAAAVGGTGPAAASGPLTVTAENRSGDPVGGATVVLYDDNWNHLGTRTTDGSGTATWSSVSDGRYHVELYVDGEFWGGDQVDVSGDGSTTIRRAEPYETDITLDDANGDGTVEVGETVTVSPRVYNDAPYARDVRVQIQVDTDGDGAADSSVTRGPLSISSGGHQWYGYDFTPDTSGTHRVRVRVETAFGDRWALTDETDWRSFEVASDEGSLTVDVEDRAGDDVSDAAVVLYDDDWNHVDTERTDGGGDADWSGLSAGEYRFEVYVDGAFWGGGRADVVAGEPSGVAFERSEPYEERTNLDDASGDGTVEVGETVTISPGVRNDGSVARSVKVRIFVDTDDDGTAEETVTRGPVTVDGGDRGWFGYEFVPETDGAKRVRVEVRTDISDWTLTDETDWRSFEVASDEGSLTVDVEDRTGDDVSDAAVVLYDDSWNRVGTKRTDGGGDADWSGLSAGEYRFEVYVDDAFWGGGRADVVAGEPSGVAFERSEPYGERVELDDASGDGTVEVGETVTVSPGVRNDVSADRRVKVDVLVDTDGDGTAEEAVARGPVTVDGGDRGWFGYEFVPDAAGEKRVRVRVHTEFDGAWALTDDTGWTSSFEVGTAREGLSVSVSDGDGGPADGVVVSLYRDGRLVGERTTGTGGEVSWSDRSVGTYRIELRRGDEFWGRTSVAFDGDPVSVSRREPFAEGTTVSDVGDGDGTVEVGEPVLFGSTVRNGGEHDRDVRVTYLVDTDGDGVAEESLVTDSTVRADGDRRFGVEFTPETDTAHRVRSRVETRIDGEWVLTDTTAWNDGFEVGSTGASVRIRVVDTAGEPIEGAHVETRGGIANETGPDGWTRLAGLAGGNHVVTVSKTGLDAREFEIEAETDETRAHELTVRRERATIESVEGVPERYLVDEQFTVAVEVSNPASASRTFDVSLPERTGTEVAGSSEKRVTVPAESTETVSFDVSLYGTETERTLRFQLVSSDGTELDRKRVRTRPETQGQIRVSVRNRAGEPMSDIDVALVDATVEGTTDARGRVRLTDVTPGRHLVYVDDERYDRSFVEVTVERGTTATAELTLSEGASVTGTLTDETGDPIESGVVVIDGRVAEVSDGDFSFGRRFSPDQAYDVVVRVDGTVVATRRASLETGENELDYTVSVPESDGGFSTAELSYIATEVFKSTAYKGFIFGSVGSSVGAIGAGSDAYEAGSEIDSAEDIARNQIELRVANGYGAAVGFGTGIEEAVEGIVDIITGPLEFVRDTIDLVTAVLDDLGLIEEIIRLIPQQIQSKQRSANPYDAGTEVNESFAHGWYGGYATYLIAEAVIGTKGATKISKVSKLKKVKRVPDKKKILNRQLKKRGVDFGDVDSTTAAQFRKLDLDTQRRIRDLQQTGELDEADLDRMAEMLEDDPDGTDAETLLDAAESGGDLSQTKYAIDKDGVSGLENDVVWLEEGTSSTGLQHIIERHGAKQFYDLDGIEDPDDVAELIKTAVKEGEAQKIPEADGGGAAFEYAYSNDDLITVVVGDNGYIVTARRGGYE